MRKSAHAGHALLHPFHGALAAKHDLFELFHGLLEHGEKILPPLLPCARKPLAGAGGKVDEGPAHALGLLGDAAESLVDDGMDLVDFREQLVHVGFLQAQDARHPRAALFPAPGLGQKRTRVLQGLDHVVDALLHAVVELDGHHHLLHPPVHVPGIIPRPLHGGKGALHDPVDGLHGAPEQVLGFLDQVLQPLTAFGDFPGQSLLVRQGAFRLAVNLPPQMLHFFGEPPHVPAEIPEGRMAVPHLGRLQVHVEGDAPKLETHGNHGPGNPFHRLQRAARVLQKLQVRRCAVEAAAYVFQTLPGPHLHLAQNGLPGPADKTQGLRGAAAQAGCLGVGEMQLVPQGQKVRLRVAGQPAKAPLQSGNLLLEAAHRGQGTCVFFLQDLHRGDGGAFPGASGRNKPAPPCRAQTP